MTVEPAARPVPPVAPDGPGTADATGAARAFDARVLDSTSVRPITSAADAPAAPELSSDDLPPVDDDPPSGELLDLDEPVIRPPLWQLVRYVFGARLDRRYSGWVLHDVTCRTWWLRHFARVSIKILPPLALYLALVPGNMGLLLLTGLTFAGGFYLYSFVNILVSTDRRAVRAGFSYGMPARLRSDRSEQRQRDGNRARRERVAQRQARRRY